ncbi:MAG: hypothetical protein B6244_03755 [Candidatus Cloacimonetes bacterium 4572_55]|nr:MAG: hypothetical protein B6244_03755 [Candidatus Cloacimonetes bacterium 4572_55]
MRRRSFKNSLYVLLILLLVPAFLWAGTTGKISGKVFDKKTGDPLPGCNIIILGSSMGAMVGLDGSYFIINIPPGEYEVQASMMGYARTTQQKVKVASDRTFPLDFELSEEVLKGEEITVIAKVPLVVRDNTSSTRTVSGADIKNMPVDNYNEALATAAGTVGEGRNMHVRGGRAGEVLYLVDGLPVRDPLVSGSSGMQISDNAISELNMLSGGFGAEYGDAQSGVINIVTQDGKAELSGNFRYRTDDLGFSSLNKNSFNSDYAEISLSGAEPVTNYLLKSLGLKLPGKPMTFFLTITGDVSDTYLGFDRERIWYEGPFFDYQQRQKETTTGSLKLSWPMSDSKKLTFSYRYSREYNDYYEHVYKYAPFNSDRSERVGDQQSLSWRHTLSKATFYTMNFSRFATWFEYLPGGRRPDDFPFESDYENFQYPEDITDIDQNEPYQDGDVILLNDGRGGEPFEDIDGNGLRSGADPYESYVDLNGNNQYDAPNFYKNEFGDDIATMPYRDWWEPYLDRNGNGVYDPPNQNWDNDEYFADLNFNGEQDLADEFWDPAQFAEPYKDLNGNGSYDLGEPFYDRNNNSKWDRDFPGGFDRYGFWQERESVIWTAKGDLTSQINNQHQLKAGLEYKYYVQKMYEIQYPDREYNGMPDGGPYPERGIFRDNYSQFPSSGAIYFQDKMEFEGMIVNAGFRYDFYWAGEKVADEPFLDDNGNGRWDENEGFTDLDLNGTWNKLDNQWKDKLSPRLGISYPITENDVLYFSYGHFSQMPELQFVYQRATQGGSAIRSYGNPSLSPQKTVAYEFGVDHAFNDNLKIDLTGFFKDTKDLINQEHFRPQGQPDFYMYVNSDYGSVRGFEMELTKRYSHNFSARFNYTFSVAKGSNSSESAGYFNDLNGIPQPVRENYLDWDERNSISASFDLRFTEGNRPNLLGLTLPDRWGLNILWQYSSGLPFTLMPENANAEEQALVNNEERMPWTSTVDARLDKDFELLGLNQKLFFEIRNLFDKENVNNVNDPGSGSSTYGVWYGDGVSEIDRDPSNLNPGRNIRFGFEILW